MAVKMSVNLSDEAAADLKKMADKNNVTITEQLRRSISTELWREKVTDSHGKILVEEPSGNVREVIFQR